MDPDSRHGVLPQSVKLLKTPNKGILGNNVTCEAYLN